MLTIRTDGLDAVGVVYDQELKNRWGGKGAGLLSMASNGLRVPGALVIGTEAWAQWRETGEIPGAVFSAVDDFLGSYPGALFSVRSGAPVSMPGMMDTVLNVGATASASETFSGAFERFADAWLRIAKGVPGDDVDAAISAARERAGADDARFARLLDLLVQNSYAGVPASMVDQIAACIEAVFSSWDTERAVAYREMNGIPHDMGTACVVQRMVMGNAPGFSGTGVMFSRDPSTGEPGVRGEIALDAQGEEVVSGAVTPRDLWTLWTSGSARERRLYEDLCKLAGDLETTYGDVQDVEFTIESGLLYVLQTRVAKMSARARIVTATDLAESLHDNIEEQADFVRSRVTRENLEAARTPSVNTCSSEFAKGLAASPGALCGRVVTRKTPLNEIDSGCILVAGDTAPEDFPRMAKAGAIFTAVGGMTSHSAVVARGIGRPAVVGCGDLHVTKGMIKMLGKVVKPGDFLTLCGTSGRVWRGEHPATPSTLSGRFLSLLGRIAKHRYPEGYLCADVGLPSSALKGLVIACRALDPVDVARASAEVDAIMESDEGLAAYVSPIVAYPEDDVVEADSPSTPDLPDLPLVRPADLLEK